MKLSLSSKSFLFAAGIAFAAANVFAADTAPSGPYTLPPLPYAADALEPHVDKKTMEIHHGKHHKAYIDNANKALVDHPELAKLSPEELLLNLDNAPAELRTTLLNNVGGHYNHSLFWQMMAPDAGGQPTGALAEAINEKFGSFEAFQKEFAQAASQRFGSGWAWLVANKDGTVEVINTPNQDPPLGNDQLALIGIDVWEHAYYLKYQNRRGDYVTEWWNVANWPFAAERYESVKN